MMGGGFAKVETFGVIRLQVFLQEGQPYLETISRGKKTIQVTRVARFRDHVTSYLSPFLFLS